VITNPKPNRSLTLAVVVALTLSSGRGLRGERALRGGRALTLTLTLSSGRGPRGVAWRSRDRCGPIQNLCNRTA